MALSGGQGLPEGSGGGRQRGEMARARRVAVAAAAAAALGLVLWPGGARGSGENDEAPEWARVWSRPHAWAFCAETAVMRERGVLDNLHWLEKDKSGGPAGADLLQWGKTVRKQVQEAGLVEEAGETRGKFSLQWPRHLNKEHQMVFGCQEVCDSCTLLDSPYPAIQIHEGYGIARELFKELGGPGKFCPECETCPDLPEVTVECGAATEFTVEPSAEAAVQLNIPVRVVLGSKEGEEGADGKTNVAKIFYSERSSYHFYTYGPYLGWAGSMAQTIQGQPGGGRGLDIADLACGSGWMGILLGAAFPESRVHFSDIDPSALNDVRTAVAANGMTGRTTVNLGDMWRAFDGLKGEDGERKRFHHVYFYPPQIAPEESEVLEAGRKKGSTVNVVAVTAPKRLFFFEECAKEWTQWLRTGGTLWLGVDHENLADVKILFERYAGGRKIKWQRWFLAPSMSPKKPQALWWTAQDTLEREVSQLLAVTLLD